jgi:hypothetical protein
MDCRSWSIDRLRAFRFWGLLSSTTATLEPSRIQCRIITVAVLSESKLGLLLAVTGSRRADLLLLEAVARQVRPESYSEN